jgi:hypothetical protein
MSVYFKFPDIENLLHFSPGKTVSEFFRVTPEGMRKAGAHFIEFSGRLQSTLFTQPSQGLLA